MKKEINSAIIASGVSIGEIVLFREMANIFNNNPIIKSTYIEEIHGNKGKVEFASSYKVGGVAKVELGDLLLFTFDKATKQLRLCTLQAKYKPGRYTRFLKFKADLFQWELLSKKPNVSSKGRFSFPSNILNFRTDYKSITAYGIFYHDIISGDIDYLYTLPEHIIPHSYPIRRLSKGNRTFNFSCPIMLGSPNRTCTKGIYHKEAISSCSIDVFEEQVKLCKVGAPLDSTIDAWALSLLRDIRERADDSSVIDELLSYYKDRDLAVQSDYSFESIPSVLVVVTDSKLSQQ